MKITKNLKIEIGRDQVLAGLATAATIIATVGIIIIRGRRKR